MENYNYNGSGSVVLFIENLDINVIKFKKEFVLRGGRGKGDFIKYNEYLKGCRGVQGKFG